VGFFLYHDKEFNPELMHVEACLPVKLPVPDGEAVKVREVAGGTFARTVFTGPYAEMHPAHIALINYLEAEKLECCGPTREVFLNSIHDTEPKDLKTVIFYPVKPRD
jgi:effector-binding domain-containing protein